MKSIKKRYRNKKLNPVFFSILTVTTCILFLTLGFSAFSTELSINEILAIVRVQKDIRITAINLTNSTSNATSHWEEYNVSSIFSGITLPNSDSTVTYNIKVINIGNMESTITDITGLPSNLTYTLNNYELRDMMCDDTDATQCKLGSITTLLITIGYAENGYDNTNISYMINMNFEFSYIVDSVAMIDNKLYDKLQDAIDEVPANNTQTTIKLLNNTSEILAVSENQNIIFNLNDRTVSNNGNNPVLVNNGTIEVTNGTITTNATTNGAINNELNGKITISSRVIVTGGRQALYNNKGIAIITDNAYLSSCATERAAVQNVANGTLTITGGTIISTESNAIQNAGTMTIGTKDEIINRNSPIIQGISSGIASTTNYNFYDGTVKGVTMAFDPISKVANIETGYNIISSEESISTTVYKTAYLGIGIAITFNYNGGNNTETIRYVESGSKIGALPNTYRAGYTFDGWFTANTGGTEITSNTIITKDITYYAHWTDVFAAMIGTTEYRTLQNAINTVSTNGTETTIILLMNTNENIKTKAGQNIVFDFQNYTLSPISSGSAVIENYATMTIVSGTITSNGTAAVINNNNGGKLIISGGSIIATGTKQAVYNNSGGYVEITDNAYLSSTATGTPTGSSIERATAQNLSGGIMNITGGTIVGLNQQAISNEGILTVGSKDGFIYTSSPVITGNTIGIKSISIFNFYDGIIKGRTNGISGTISDQEPNSQLINETETINGILYKTIFLN